MLHHNSTALQKWKVSTVRQVSHCAHSKEAPQVSDVHQQSTALQTALLQICLAAQRTRLSKWLSQCVTDTY